jgi:hypothetical protein
MGAGGGVRRSRRDRGTGERYKDAPWAAVRSKPAGFYVLLNATAAMGALAVIHKFGWTFGATQWYLSN